MIFVFVLIVCVKNLTCIILLAFARGFARAIVLNATRFSRFSNIHFHYNVVVQYTLLTKTKVLITKCPIPSIQFLESIRNNKYYIWTQTV